MGVKVLWSEAEKDTGTIKSLRRCSTFWLKHSLIHVSSKPVNCWLKLRIWSSSVRLQTTEPLPRPFLHLGSLGRPGQGALAAKTKREKEEDRLRPDTISLENPGATPTWVTACHCEKWQRPLQSVARGQKTPPQGNAGTGRGAEGKKWGRARASRQTKMTKTQRMDGQTSLPILEGTLN